MGHQPGARPRARRSAAWTVGAPAEQTPFMAPLHHSSGPVRAPIGDLCDLARTSLGPRSDPLRAPSWRWRDCPALRRASACASVPAGVEKIGLHATCSSASLTWLVE